MKIISRFALIIMLFTSTVNAQQKVIPLYKGSAPGSENWTWDEMENNKNSFNRRVVYNVSKPSLTVFLPEQSIATGTAVVICPGGAFHTLSIDGEGYEVARWLNKKGIAAFVLKYRLVHSLTNDPVQELMAKMADNKKMEADNDAMIPLAIADGGVAIEYVRNHAAEFGVDPKKIGIIGFSAGGTIAAALAYKSTSLNRPDFSAPIYAYVDPKTKAEVSKDAPPLFILAATDDPYGFASHSIDLYSDWIKNKRPAELHLYAKGGHGFGMKKQNLPTDNWIERFADWLTVQGFLK